MHVLHLTKFFVCGLALFTLSSNALAADQQKQRPANRSRSIEMTSPAPRRSQEDCNNPNGPGKSASPVSNQLLDVSLTLSEVKTPRETKTQDYNDLDDMYVKAAVALLTPSNWRGSTFSMICPRAVPRKGEFERLTVVERMTCRNNRPQTESVLDAALRLRDEKGKPRISPDVANRLVNKFLEELIAGKSSNRSPLEILQERFGEGPTLFERLVLFSKNTEKEHNYEFKGQLTSLLKKLSPDQEAFLFANALGTAKKAEKGENTHKDAHDVLDWIVENKLGGQESYYGNAPKGASRDFKDIQELGAKLLNRTSGNSGKTPLHVALENLRLAKKEKSSETGVRLKEGIRLLLENGANPTVPDASGLTAERIAAKLGDPQITSAITNARMTVTQRQIEERQIEAFEAYLRGGRYEESIRKILTQFPPICPGLTSDSDFLEMVTCRHPNSKASLLSLAVRKLSGDWNPKELSEGDENTYIKNLVSNAVLAMSGNRGKGKEKGPKWNYALLEDGRSDGSSLLERLIKISQGHVFDEADGGNHFRDVLLPALVTEAPWDQQVYLYYKQKAFVGRAWKKRGSSITVGAQDKSGNTALHLALQNLNAAKERASKSKTENDKKEAQKEEDLFRGVVKVLLDGGASASVQNGQKKTPALLAAETGDLELLKLFKKEDFEAKRGILGTSLRQRSALQAMPDRTRREYQEWLDQGGQRQTQSNSSVQPPIQAQSNSRAPAQTELATSRPKSASAPMPPSSNPKKLDFRKELEQKLQTRSNSQVQPRTQSQPQTQPQTQSKAQTQPRANPVRNESLDQIATSEQVKAFELLGEFYKSRENQKDESRKFGVQSTPKFHEKKAAVLGNVKVLLKKQVCPDLRGDANLAEILTCTDNKTAPSLLQRALIGFYGAGQINGVSYYVPVRRLFLSEFYRYVPTGTRNRPELKPIKMDSPPCNTLTKENVEQLHLTLDEKAALKGACPDTKY